MVLCLVNTLRRSGITRQGDHGHTTLIVGQGLAGTAVAWALHRQGQDFVIIDPGSANVASRIAAGLVTPVAGKRFAVAPHFTSLFVKASRFYASIERQLERSFFVPQPALRLCYSQEEVELFNKRSEALINAGQIRLCSRDELTPFISPRCGFLMPNAARLITTRYLHQSRRFFESQRKLCAASVNVEQIEVSPNGIAIPSLGLRGSRIVFCRGHVDQSNHWLPEGAFNCAKGEVLNVKIPGYNCPYTVHAKKSWLNPGSEPSVFSFGATYEHDNFKHGTTSEAREELAQRLAGFVKQPFTIEGQQYGIRPIGMQRKAIVGRHEEFTHVAWLNGLGSKGSVLAPYLATELVAALVEKRRLKVELTEAIVSG